MTTILVCTVGGTPDPILNAIKAREPDHVLFVVSDSGGIDKRGSRSEIDGQGYLSPPWTIPARAGLPPEHVEMLTVPPDDPDVAFARCREALAELLARFPGAALYADYTGGTKSMTAALMMAAAGLDDRLSVQFVAGKRLDLVKVAAGTERAQAMSVDLILAERLLERAAAAFDRHGYAEAELILPEKLPATAPVSLARRLAAARAAATILAAWDRFDHKAALAAFDAAPPGLLGDLRPALTCLATDDRDTREPLVLLDLWRNALRRAARGRHDDAVARCYRLVEWTAQWVLWCERWIQTDQVRRDEIGDALFTRLARKREVEKLKIGLDQALDVIRELLPEHSFTTVLGRKGKASPALKELSDERTGWKELRNRSIHAHGFEPLREQDWLRVRDWFERHWLPWMTRELDARRLVLPDLPRALPDA